MKYLDLTLSTPYHNLACDEALLTLCESGLDEEILRFWESKHYFAVLGHSDKITTEINLPVCRAKKLSVLRRPSGGGTVLQGPGCLNYTLILKIQNNDLLNKINNVHEYVLTRHQQALQPLCQKPIRISGISDLALGPLKFSGNAQRRKRRFVLMHGTFLLNFNLALIETLLPMPTRQPEYRMSRPHRSFLTNLNLSAETVKNSLMQIWGATKPFQNVPFQLIDELAKSKYSNDEWTFKF